MARTQRRISVLTRFVLADRHPARAVRSTVCLHPAAASATVVSKKLAEGSLPAEAQAAEAAPAGVVRKKLPAPPAAPVSAEAVPRCAGGASDAVQAAEPAPAPADAGRRPKTPSRPRRSRPRP
ncbi:MAG: hypothetical protein MZV70_55535 [Desulfobacterales bacterium]|nr:hypothetical protein [Desulfobacterales bacterium]